MYSDQRLLVAVCIPASGLHISGSGGTVWLFLLRFLVAFSLGHLGVYR